VGCWDSRGEVEWGGEVSGERGGCRVLGEEGSVRLGQVVAACLGRSMMIWGGRVEGGRRGVCTRGWSGMCKYGAGCRESWGGGGVPARQMTRAVDDRTASTDKAPPTQGGRGFAGHAGMMFGREGWAGRGGRPVVCACVSSGP